MTEEVKYKFHDEQKNEKKMANMDQEVVIEILNKVERSWGSQSHFKLHVTSISCILCNLSWLPRKKKREEESKIENVERRGK